MKQKRTRVNEPNYYCKFCPKGSPRRKLILANEIDLYPYVKYRHCRTCKTEYSYFGPDKTNGVDVLSSYKIRHQVGDVTYVARFYVNGMAINKETRFILYAELARSFEIEPYILELTYHPDITPANFSKKLPTILTFS